jgi:dnd system-associated protein 4
MADIRIKVAKDKARLVKALRAGEGSTGPFQTYYEVLVFAAALGVKKKNCIPFKESEASRDIDPIRQEQFASKGYDQIINLLAIMHNREPHLLGKTEDSETQRVAIFEAYVNGGLEMLENSLRGSADIANQVLLLVSSEREGEKSKDEDILDLNFLA